MLFLLHYTETKMNSLSSGGFVVKTYRFTINHVFVEKDSVSDIGVFKDDETKATGTTSETILDDNRLQNLTKGLKIVTETIFSGFPRDPTDEELTWRIKLHPVEWHNQQ